MFYSYLYLLIIFITLPISAFFSVALPEIGPSIYNIEISLNQATNLYLNCMLIFLTASLGVFAQRYISNHRQRTPSTVKKCCHLKHKPHINPPRLTRLATILILVMIALFSIGPLRLIYEYGLLNTNRIIFLPDGMGRYSISATIFNSFVCIFSFFIAQKHRNTGKIIIFILLFIFLFLTNSWSGGRSIALVYSAPVGFLLLDQITPRRKVTLFVLVSIFFVVLFAYQSNLRSHVYQLDTYVGGFLSVFKWEIGRSIPFLWAIEIRQYGYQSGLLSGMAFLRNLIGDLYQIYALAPAEFIFQYIFGYNEFSFFAVGAIVELYLLIGNWVFPIIFFISAIFAQLESRNSASKTPNILYFFLIAIILFRFLPIGISSAASQFFYFIIAFVIIKSVLAVSSAK